MTKHQDFSPNTLPGRVKQRLAAMNLSAIAACERAGVSSSTIKNIYAGSSRAPRADTLARLAAALKTTPEWLMSGDEDGSQDETMPITGDRDLPLMSTLLAAKGGDFVMNGNVSDYVLRPASLRFRRRTFCVLVPGDKMQPAFVDGAPVIVDPDRHPMAGDDVIIEIKPSSDGAPGDCYLRRFLRRNPDGMTVEQHNPPMQLDFASKDVLAVYRVVPMRELIGL
jgi:phage repressor protein C with HTH and peptisase S24 domain